MAVQPACQISLKLKKLFVDGRTYVWIDCQRVDLKIKVWLPWQCPKKIVTVLTCSVLGPNCLRSKVSIHSCSALCVQCTACVALGVWHDHQRDWWTWPSSTYYNSHLCHTSAQSGVWVKCEVRVCDMSYEVCSYWSATSREPRSILIFAVCRWAHEM